jgi:hypothetical protein
MPQIFISYRRDDSLGICGRINDRLIHHFGKDGVFRDLDSIPLGADFKHEIRVVLHKCSVQLVLIGPRWLIISDDAGNVRLGEPDDVLRTEIELAFELGVPVIPVLVEGAKMPSQESLPQSIRQLANINSAKVRHDPDFEADMKRLLDGLIVYVPSAQTAQYLTENVDTLPAASISRESASGGSTILIAPQFTMYYPKEVSPGIEKPLLLYAYADSMFDVWREDLGIVVGEMANGAINTIRNGDDQATLTVPDGAELTFVPEVQGMIFHPKRVSLRVHQDVNRVRFRMTPDASIAGRACNGEIAVYMGPLLIAALRFSLFVSGTSQASQAITATATTRLFVCLASEDAAVIEPAIQALKALGLSVQADYMVREGPNWKSEINRLIETADVFQLYWSTNAAKSAIVQYELDYALSLGRRNFIRPVYWERRLAPVPPALRDIHFARIDLPTDL